MNMPRHIRVKPNQVAIRAWVVLQIGVALLATDFGMAADRRNRGCKDEDDRSNEAWGNRKQSGQEQIADQGGNVHLSQDSRHGRACPSHPRLRRSDQRKAWMPGTSPGMTGSKHLSTATE